MKQLGYVLGVILVGLVMMIAASYGAQAETQGKATFVVQ